MTGWKHRTQCTLHVPVMNTKYMFNLKCFTVINNISHKLTVKYHIKHLIQIIMSLSTIFNRLNILNKTSHNTRKLIYSSQ